MLVPRRPALDNFFWSEDFVILYFIHEDLGFDILIVFRRFLFLSEIDKVQFARAQTAAIFLIETGDFPAFVAFISLPILVF